MSTKSDTPETDAMLIENAEDDCGNPFDGVSVDFARKLERERNELISAIRNLRDVHGRYHTQIATDRLFELLHKSTL